MQKIHYLLVLGVLSMACERNDPDPEESIFSNQLTNGFCISIGDSILINHHDIDYYDYSTHFIYLKKSHPIFTDPVDWELANQAFTTYAFKEEIYTGIIFPAWASSIPSGPFIQWPSFYPGYIVPIDFMSPPGNLRPDTLTDPRSDQRIVDVLQEYGQYHKGISLELGSVQVDDPGKVTFTYTLHNEDSYDYFVLSPEKMGTGLFHYFTNGLYLFNQETGWLQHQVDVEAPEPWDSWETVWLDRLNHNSSRTYEIEYDEFDQIPPGTYSLHFRFPGLSHVALEDRNMNGALVWMGELTISTEILIDYPPVNF